MSLIGAVLEWKFPEEEYPGRRIDTRDEQITHWDVTGVAQPTSEQLATYIAEFNSLVSAPRALPSVILQSPNGTLWELTVDNDGILDTKEVVP